MARQVIVNGNVPNDGAGDTLREGARKINENFIELYSKQLPAQPGNEGRFLKTNGTQAFWDNLNVINIPGNAGTVTNGVYTTGSYSNPSWIASLDASKLTGTVVATNGVVTTGSYTNPAWIASLSFDKITGTVVATNGVVTTGNYINPDWIVSLDGSKLTGTVVATNGVVTNALYSDPDWIVSLDGGKVINAVLTTGTYNDPSWINSLSGSKISGNISGNAGTVTNGVYTTGDQTISGTKTFNSTITGSISGNAGTVTDGVYTTGSYSDPSWITGLSPTKVLPDQSTNSGKFLTTDGNSLSWADPYDQSLNTDDDVQFNNIDADKVILANTGTSEIESLTDLRLKATGAVVVTNSVFRVHSYDTSGISGLTGVNGDIIYNTSTNKFQGFAGGSWVDLH